MSNSLIDTRQRQQSPARSRWIVVLALAGLITATMALPAGADYEAGPDPRIVGGTQTTDVNEWPFMVALVNTTTNAQFCGGALITPTWVLTAAHCFFVPGTNTQDVFMANLSLILGALNVADPTIPTPPGAEIIAAAQIIPHPGYDGTALTSEDDIALVQLATPSNRATAKLGFSGNQSSWAPGMLATAKGWGAQVSGGPGSPDLRQVQIPIISDAQCDAADTGTMGIIDGKQICAGDLVNGGVDACQGDSGGPLAVPGPGSWIHVGASSFGVGCAGVNQPGVWTETAGYIGWIAANIPGFNEAPTAYNDGPFAVNRGATLNQTSPRLTGNDTDLEGNPLTAAVVSNPANGTVTVNLDGSFTYVHNGSATTSDSFTYRVNDGTSDSNVATVNLTVQPLNRPPTVAAPIADVSVAVNAPDTVIPTAGVFTDPDGDTLTLSVTTDNPGLLTATVTNPLTLDYKTNQTGVANVTLTATDPGGLTASDTFKVTVAPVAHDVGLVDPATGNWHLRKASTGAVTTFAYGVPGDIPFMGDWDCNGTETPGLYRQSDGFAYIRNSNSQGVADISFFMGNPSDIPLAGDFNGNGCDTVSVYRPGEQRIYIANTLGANGGAIVSDFSYVFGNPGDKPFVGDFNGNGSETIGLHREANGFVYFRNTHTIGNADVTYFFGDPGDSLVAGDWGVVDGVFTPAVFRPSLAKFFFRHTNTQGLADSEFFFGQGTWRPVSGAMGLG